MEVKIRKPLKTLNFGGEDTYYLNPSWDNVEDKPFGETIVTKEAITWDGNTDGLYNIMGTFFNVSNAIPTLEDVQQGGSVTLDGNEIPFTSANVMDLGALGMGSDFILIMPNNIYAAGVALKAGATATMDGVTVAFNKTGIYFLKNPEGEYTSELTINDHTFTETEIKTLDKKYLPPIEASDLDMFEEGIAYSKVDALTWDGDTTGLYSPDGEGYKWFISDTVPTLEDLSNGGTITVSAPSMSITDTMTFNSTQVAVETEEVVYIRTSTGDAYVVVVSSPNVIYGNNTYEKAGVYFIAEATWYTSEFTINGFTGFSVAVPQIKLKEEYLPEHLQFGESTVMGDTISWDRNTDGKTFIDPFGNGQYLFCCVSDAVPTIDDFANGAKVKHAGYSGAGELEIPASDMLSLGNGVLLQKDFKFGIIPNDNMTVAVPYEGTTLNITYPKKGVYLGDTVGVGYVKSLTINGYTGFETTEVKTIDPKYLPAGMTNDTVFNITGTNIGGDNGGDNTIACNKSLTELKGMSNSELLNVRIIWTNASGQSLEFRPTGAGHTDEGIAVNFVAFVTSNVIAWRIYYTDDYFMLSNNM